MGNYFSNLSFPAQATIALLVLAALLRPRQLQFLAKMTIFWFWFLVSCNYAVLRGLLMRHDAANLNHHGARFFSFVGPLLGVSHTVEGLENLDNQPCVYAMNHQSTMDVLALAQFMPKNTGIIAKKELKYAPFFGWYIGLGNNVLLDRGNHTEAMKAMEKAGKELSEKKVRGLMAIFFFR